MTYPMAVFVSRSSFISFKVAATDPKTRSRALAACRAQNAPRRYRALVKAFADFDRENGVEPAFVDRFVREALADVPKSRS